MCKINVLHNGMGLPESRPPTAYVFRWEYRFGYIETRRMCVDGRGLGRTRRANHQARNFRGAGCSSKYSQPMGSFGSRFSAKRERRASYGYMAVGGPGFADGRDLPV